MKKFAFPVLLLISQVSMAEVPEGFSVQDISMPVKNLSLDSINLSTPMDYYKSRTWVRLTGRERYWQAISSSKFNFDKNAPDEAVDDELRNYILNENIDYIVTYRDSVASIVCHTDGEDYVLLNHCWIEDGRWVNGGQAMADDLNDAQEVLLARLPQNYRNLPRIAQINKLPGDVAPFADFLRNIKTSPEQYVFDMLSSHKLVINGEIHRRKVSWDMLQRLISMPDFHKITGTIFMELPSWCQPVMDRFMESDTLEPEYILQIFREEQLNGWWDRGEYDFLCKLWKINRALPAEERIRVVLADYQIPYSRITSREEREKEDRNTHMADIIERNISASKDKRNNLFLVGCAHAYKSDQAGIASAAYTRESENTAASQLVARLGENNVFTIFQHIISGDNSGNNKQPIRGGVFDRAFEINNNTPVGFSLAGSPFGKEPFDGVYEIKYNISTGSYEDNFDGYLFLHPIADEPKATPLTEIFTDDFVAEMQRRASVMGWDNLRGIWFGKKASELTKEYIIDVLSQR